MATFIELLNFGPDGWGQPLLIATGMTLAVSVAGFALGSVFGAVGATAKLSDIRLARYCAGAYTTVLRGIPDLLVIYLFYFGGSAALTSIAAMFGSEGFVGAPTFLSGAAAVGVISGAYQTEVFRGAFNTLHRGELEAARSVGMHRWLMFRRVVLPQVLRVSLPGLGNVWQMVLKESALISVTGLVELLRQSQVAAGSTGRAFEFYLTACAIYLLIAVTTSKAFATAERSFSRGFRRAV